MNINPRITRDMVDRGPIIAGIVAVDLRGLKPYTVDADGSAIRSAITAGQELA